MTKIENKIKEILSEYDIHADIEIKNNCFTIFLLKGDLNFSIRDLDRKTSVFNLGKIFNINKYDNLQELYPIFSKEYQFLNKLIKTIDQQPNFNISMTKYKSNASTLACDEQSIKKVLNERKALLEGHFILSSGLHSKYYLQCARLLSNPQLVSELARLLANLISDDLLKQIDLVISPAMGGLIIGHEMARKLDHEFMFVERVDNKFELRRGFEINKGQKVLLVEDVLTTGLSSREAIKVIEEAGGIVVGVASIIERGEPDLPVSHISLLKLDLSSYKPDELPEELVNIPAVKLGSRNK